MKKALGFALVLLVAGVVVCGILLGEAVEPKKKDVDKKEPEKKGTPGTTIVRNYNNYAEDAVFELSNEERSVPVRFQASFNMKLDPVPVALRTIRAGKTTLTVGLAFETQRELVCVVQKKDLELIKEAGKLVKGQQFTVEGVTLPPTGGHKLVLVDDLKFGGEQVDKGVAMETVVYWPGEKPKLLKQTGTYTLKVPDPNDKTKTIEFRVELRKVRETAPAEKGGTP